MVSRIATYAQNYHLNQTNMRLQGSVNTISAQMSSGYKSATYGGMAQESQSSFSVSSTVSRLNDYITNIQTASDRIEVMYDAVLGITDLINSIKSDISAAISGDQISDAQLQTAAQEAYEAIIAQINTQVSGRYLFSGAATLTAPVDVNDPLYPAFITPSTADTSYYQGDGTIMSVVAGDDYRINYGVTADQTGFEETLRALNLLINNPGDAATRTEAMELLQSGHNALTTVAHELSVQATVLESRQSEHEETKTYMENVLTDLVGADLAAASTQLSQAETLLEASYSATATILSLHLYEYLK